jgi:hypothetical protein
MLPFVVRAADGADGRGRSAMPEPRKAKAAPTVSPARCTGTRAVSPSTFATTVEA